MGINIFNPTLGSAGQLVVDDDGTYYLFKVSGVELFRINKTTYKFETRGNMSGGYTP